MPPLRPREVYPKTVHQVISPSTGHPLFFSLSVPGRFSGSWPFLRYIGKGRCRVYRHDTEGTGTVVKWVLRTGRLNTGPRPLCVFSGDWEGRQEVRTEVWGPLSFWYRRSDTPSTRVESGPRGVVLRPSCDSFWPQELRRTEIQKNPLYSILSLGARSYILHLMVTSYQGGTIRTYLLIWVCTLWDRESSLFRNVSLGTVSFTQGRVFSNVWLWIFPSSFCPKGVCRTTTLERELPYLETFRRSNFLLNSLRTTHIVFRKVGRTPITLFGSLSTGLIGTPPRTVLPVHDDDDFWQGGLTGETVTGDSGPSAGRVPGGGT